MLLLMIMIGVCTSKSKRQTAWAFTIALRRARSTFDYDYEHPPSQGYGVAGEQERWGDLSADFRYPESIRIMIMSRIRNAGNLLSYFPN